MIESALLIDWLTLRLPLVPALGAALLAKLQAATNSVCCYDGDGVIRWEKRVLDFDALRSDETGLFWTIQNDGKVEYLVIGASPASLEFGLNVFGHLDIKRGASVLISHAQRALEAVLPDVEHWHCTRIDVTGNFALPSAAAVKSMLKQLMLTDGARRVARSGVRAGDSVYWNPSSDLTKGKAYHKGPQLLKLMQRKGKEIDADHLKLAQRVIRLEHTRGARWFRRLAATGKRWFEMGESYLAALFVDFFERLVDASEVTDMERDKVIAAMVRRGGCTERQAGAAWATFLRMQAEGYEAVRLSMAHNTFHVHQRLLRAGGVADTDMRSGDVRKRDGNVIPFGRRIRIELAQPVGSWAAIRAAA